MIMEKFHKICLFLLVWLPGIYCHPQCLDYRPPFEASSKLLFCSQYSDFGCCTNGDDLDIRSRYTQIIGRLKDQGVIGCASLVKEILCQKCSPYAAHLFDAEYRTQRPLPGLCINKCDELYSSCKAAVSIMTNDSNVLGSLSSKEKFCQVNALPDADFCYPDLVTNLNLTSNLRSESQTEEGCLCLEEFAANLRNPVFARSPKDGSGRIFIAEQVGLVHIYFTKNGTRIAEPFMNITDQVHTSSDYEDERGLLGIEFHPDFASNAQLYIYSSIINNQQQKIQISEFLVNPQDPNEVDMQSERVLLRIDQPYDNHNGGEILFGTDGYLYIFPGDGGAGGDPHGNAQNMSVLLGKVLRVDVDTGNPSVPYNIPSDNPFINEVGARSEIYAYGCRNMWRCDVDEGDPVTKKHRGRIICGDVGQNEYEEIDIITKGGNYGWNAREGFECFDQALCGNIADEVLPIHAYNHSVGKSVTGGHVYRGCLNPNLQGQYIYGDFMTGRIWKLVEDEAGKWENEEVKMCGEDVCFNGLISDYKPNILSFGEDENGEMYMLTTSFASTALPLGTVYRIVDPRRRGDPTECKLYKSARKREALTEAFTVPLEMTTSATQNYGQSDNGEPPVNAAVYSTVLSLLTLLVCSSGVILRNVF